MRDRLVQGQRPMSGHHRNRQDHRQETGGATQAPATISLLTRIRTLAGEPCGKCLAVIIADELERLKRFGELKTHAALLTDAVRHQPLNRPVYHDGPLPHTGARRTLPGGFPVLHQARGDAALRDPDPLVGHPDRACPRFLRSRYRVKPQVLSRILNRVSHYAAAGSAT